MAGQIEYKVNKGVMARMHTPIPGLFSDTGIDWSWMLGKISKMS